MLEMRKVCERCESSLSDDGPAVICSFECTFCAACGAARPPRSVACRHRPLLLQHDEVWVAAVR